MPDLPLLRPASTAAWREWLADHHADSTGVWLALAKKGTGASGPDYRGALDEALCHGWIDGQKKASDDTHWLQRFTPRTSRSRWSRVNRDRAVELTAAGRMTSAGRREIDRAEADGRWAAAYAGARTAVVPDDLAAALAADDEARRFFSTVDSANRYAVLYRIEEAKRPETRARRIATYVAMLHRHETIHPR